MDENITLTDERKNAQALEITLGAIEKAFGKGSILQGKGQIPGVFFWPTGCMSVDRAMGGGFAKGRIAEIWGPESSGKTTLCLHVIAEVQKQGGVCAFVDAEHGLDGMYASNLGVDMDTLMVSQPDNGEQALEITQMLVNSGQVRLIVIDSVAALTPQKEIEGQMGDSNMGLQSRLMSQAMRKLVGSCYRNNCTIIFINQIRMKIGIMFGNPETTSGGNALKFYASQRLDIRRTGAVKEGEEVVGATARIKVAKSKVYPPFKEAEFSIKFGSGIDKRADLLKVAVDLNIIQKAGSWYSRGEERIGQGEAQVVAFLEQHPEMEQEIKDAVKAIYAQ